MLKMLLFNICVAPQNNFSHFWPIFDHFFHISPAISHLPRAKLHFGLVGSFMRQSRSLLQPKYWIMHIILIPFPNLWDSVYHRSILNKYCYHYPTSVTASWWGPKAFLSDSVFKQLKFNFTTSFCCYFATLVYVAAFVQVTLLLAHLSIKSAQRAVRRNPPTKHIITYLKHFTKGNFI